MSKPPKFPGSQKKPSAKVLELVNKTVPPAPGQPRSEEDYKSIGPCCGNCLFALRESMEIQGQPKRVTLWCRRVPPTVMPGVEPGNFFSQVPPVNADFGWCGEWRNKFPPEEPASAPS